MALNLSADKALVFRITHRDNVPWILNNGLHCRNSGVLDPGYVTIGNVELIDKRHGHPVSCPPGGSLGDYVPFYFTPCSMMLFNIVTGWKGLRQRAREEIVILVSSLHKIGELQIPYVFTDRHALLVDASYSSDLAELAQLDWARWRNRDFRHDPENPEKVAKYQAEALIYSSLPTIGLLGIACYNDGIAVAIGESVAKRGLNLKVAAQPKWFM